MSRFLPVLLFFAFFWTVLFGDRQFGYRDGAHYYYPLYRYVQEEISAGRLPLWNPYENLGQPLLANPTTALFYPGKLIFFLPFDFTTLYGWFVSGHILLAALLTYRLARAWRCSDGAATLAGICYAFGGNVLFQYANAPFLIGAAWFPEALLQADRMFRLKSFENAALWGTVLALMILGGDPQAAYHAILCSVGLFVFLKSPKCSEAELRGSPYFSAAPNYVRRLKLSMVGLLTMFGLAAVQILPAWELSRLSDRSLPTHVDSVYLFSVPIWRFVEFFWPNAGGVEFPVNARWFHGDDVWVPSFYMGLVPMLLAVWSMKFSFKEPGVKPVLRRSSRVRDVFLTIILIVFVLGSLGPWGGVYPLLQWLPGYGMFRFPAKLLVVAALPSAILAARGFDRLFCDGRFVDRFYYSLMVACVLAYIGAFVFVQYSKSGLLLMLLSIPNCQLFGLFNGFKANSIMVGIVFQTFAVFFMLMIPWRYGERLRQKVAPYFLLIAVADLFLANHWMVATVPRADFQEKSRIIERILTNHESRITNHEPRIYRFPTWYPLAFKYTSSKNRLSEIVRWERATLSPKYSLMERIGVVDVLGTMYPKDFYAVAGGLRWEIEHGESGDLEKRLENLGVEYVVASCGKMLEADLLLTPENGPLCTNLWKLRNPRPRNYAVFEPNRLEMDVELAEPGMITVPEQYWPGWRAFAGGKEYPIKPVNKIFRGVDLPAGKHRLTMVYDPFFVKMGAVLSIFTLFLAMLYFLTNCIKSKQQFSKRKEQ